MSGADETGRGLRLDRRALLVGGALIATGAVAAARQPVVVTPRVNKQQLEKLIPLQLGEWSYQDASGVVLPPSDALSDRLYDAIVARSYVAPGQTPIMLMIAYSNVQDGMLQVHRPEFCYPAGGYTLSPTERTEIPNGLGGQIEANAFSAEGVSRTEQVLYWTRIGDRFPQRWIDQRTAIVRANIDGYIPDGILVRVSNLDPTMAQALPALREFVITLVRDAAPLGRKLLSGA